MNEASITRYIIESFRGVEILVGSKDAGSPEIAWGDTFFFYGPDRMLPFATIVTKDYGDFDCASNLNRPGVFRLNIGVSKDTFRSLFVPKFSASKRAGVAEPEHDFTALDRLMPHPAYAPQSWVCALNPGEETFETVRPLLAEAYDLAVERTAKRETRE